jgi:hypothetical protein
MTPAITLAELLSPAFIFLTLLVAITLFFMLMALMGSRQD